VSFFVSVQLINTSPLLNFHLSAPPEIYNSPNQVSHYHFIGIEVKAFASKAELGWLQSKRVVKMSLKGTTQFHGPVLRSRDVLIHVLNRLL
jgi:hypothetical protein